MCTKPSVIDTSTGRLEPLPHQCVRSQSATGIQSDLFGGRLRAPFTLGEQAHLNPGSSSLAPSYHGPALHAPHRALEAHPQARLRPTLLLAAPTHARPRPSTQNSSHSHCYGSALPTKSLSLSLPPRAPITSSSVLRPGGQAAIPSSPIHWCSLSRRTPLSLKAFRPRCH